MNVIEVKNLTKVFKTNKKYKGKEWFKHLFRREKIVKEAVDDITF